MRPHRLCLLAFLFALSPPASADCEGAYADCRDEQCQYAAKSAAIAIGSAIAATQGRQAAAMAGRQEQRDLDSCVRQCEVQRTSCWAEARQRDTEQAQQRALDQQRAAQLEEAASASLAGGDGGSPSMDLSHPRAARALQWIDAAHEHHRAGRHQEALEHYESALDVLPDHAGARFGAMQAAEALENASAARVHAARYLELEPDDPNSKAIRRKYPDLVKAQREREEAAAKAPPPPRPTESPAEIPEAVWQKLETSVAYRAYRTALSVHSHVQWDHRWQHSDGDPGFAAVDKDIRIRSASPATSRETIRYVSNGEPSTGENLTTFGGLLTIASTLSGAMGPFGSRLLDIENLEGSLFPPRVGAVMRMTLQWERRYPSGVVEPSRKTQTCRVSGSSPARRVAPHLPGQVWSIDCAVETDGHPPRTERFDYFDAFATMGSQFLWTGNYQMPHYFPATGDIQPDSLDGHHTVKSFELAWE